MFKVIYITGNGNKTYSYSKALADGGIAKKIYEPLVKKYKPTKRALEKRIKI